MYRIASYANKFVVDYKKKKKKKTNPDEARLSGLDEGHPVEGGGQGLRVHLTSGPLHNIYTTYLILALYLLKNKYFSFLKAIIDQVYIYRLRVSRTGIEKFKGSVNFIFSKRD